jgi:hypothetical protein
VERGVTPLYPTADGVDVAEVTLHQSASEGGEILGLLRRADERDDVVPARAQLVDEMAAEEPRRAGDERLHDRPAVSLRPMT